MRKWVRTSAKTALLTAGFVALGAGVSFADSHPTTSGNGSVLGGNQIVGNVDLPVNVSGNAISAVGGVSGAKSDDTGAVIHDHADEGPTTSGNGSIGGGNQAVVDAEAPINVSGNAIAAVLGTAGAASDDTGAAVLEGGDRHHQGDDVTTSGNGSVIGGNQAVVDADVPVNASGNAVSAVLGVAGAASEDTGALVDHTDGRHHDRAREHQMSGTGDVLAPLTGALGSTDTVSQALPTGSLLDTAAGLTKPAHIKTDSIDAGPVLHQRAGEGHGDADEITTSGNGSIIGGNQAVVDADVPINIAGNAISAVGGISGAKAHDTGALVKEQRDEVTTSGNGSVIGGNQLVVDAEAPINASGNAIAAVLGTAGASSEDTGAAVVEHQSAAVEHSGNELGLPKPESVLSAAETLPLAGELPVDTTLPATSDLPLVGELPQVPGTGIIEQQAAQQPAELSGLPELPTGQVTGVLDSLR
jgi:hypothetical protein